MVKTTPWRNVDRTGEDETDLGIEALRVRFVQFDDNSVRVEVHWKFEDEDARTYSLADVLWQWNFEEGQKRSALQGENRLHEALKIICRRLSIEQLEEIRANPETFDVAMYTQNAITVLEEEAENQQAQADEQDDAG